MTGPDACISTACVGQCETHAPQRVHSVLSMMGNVHIVISQFTFLESALRIPERRRKDYDKSRFWCISTFRLFFQRRAIQQDDAPSIHSEPTRVYHSA